MPITFAIPKTNMRCKNNFECFLLDEAKQTFIC